VKTLRLDGEGKDAGGTRFPMRQITARPGRLRSEVSFQGLTAVNVYDGGKGWKVNPFAGRKDPELLGADEARLLAQDALVDGLLAGWKEKGYRIAYLGVEEIDGGPAHALRVTRPDQTEHVVWLDADTYLEIRVLTRALVRGSLVEQETDLGEYRQEKGVWWPTSLESGPPRKPRTFFLKWRTVEVDAPAPDALFQVPGK